MLCIFPDLLNMPIDAKRSRTIFEKLDRDLLKISSKASVKSVHRFRTSARRVQILLAELSPALNRNEKKLLKLLNGIRRRAGKLRDVDVQLTALRSLKTPREPRRKTQLVSRLIELHAQQENKMRKVADDEAIREIRKRLKRAGKNFRPESARDPLDAAKSMIDGFLSAATPLNEDLLHRYRILTKRARYAAELATPSPSATTFITELKRVQDALGDWHDWLTLTQSARDQLGELRESPLVAELHNVTGAKYRRAISVLSQMRGKKAAHSRLQPQSPARAFESKLPAKIPAA
jgi:CHAD domain-containing protein